MISKKRIAQVMFKEKLHSEHAAICFIEAKRRDNARKRYTKQLRKSGFIISTRSA